VGLVKCRLGSAVVIGNESEQGMQIGAIAELLEDVEYLRTALLVLLCSAALQGTY
jgi:hypothetical protein